MTLSIKLFYCYFIIVIYLLCNFIVLNFNVNIWFVTPKWIWPTGWKPLQWTFFLTSYRKDIVCPAVNLYIDHKLRSLFSDLKCVPFCVFYNAYLMVRTLINLMSSTHFLLHRNDLWPFNATLTLTDDLVKYTTRSFCNLYLVILSVQKGLFLQINLLTPIDEIMIYMEHCSSYP